MSNHADVLIYTTSHCPYCLSAKSLFQSLKVTYKEIGLDNNPELRQKLSEENNGWRTVPMIFIDGKFIGGFDDTKALHTQGKLIPLLRME